MSQVIITVKKGGQTSVKVEGVPGGQCVEASRPYKERLAGEVASDRPTEEIHQIPLSELDEQQESL